MKKFSFVTLLLIFLSGFSIADTRFTGYLHLKDGSVMCFDDIEFRGSGTDNTISVKSELNSHPIVIEPSAIQELVYLDGPSFYWWPENEVRLYILLRDGTEGDFLLGRNISTVRVRYFDNVAQSFKTMTVDARNVARIAF